MVDNLPLLPRGRGREWCKLPPIVCCVRRDNEDWDWVNFILLVIIKVKVKRKPLVAGGKRNWRLNWPSSTLEPIRPPPPPNPPPPRRHYLPDRPPPPSPSSNRGSITLLLDPLPLVNYHPPRISAPGWQGSAPAAVDLPTVGVGVD